MVYRWEDVQAWATQTLDFQRWLESLRNLWTEALLEFELPRETAGSPGRGHAAAASGTAATGAFPYNP